MKVLLPNFWLRGGLVMVVAQDIFTGEILMVAFTNQAGYLETLQTGFAIYFSRSRWKRWKKGEESGDIQIVCQILLNCNGAAVIYQVEQKGDGACHTKAKSCFYRDCFGSQIMPVPKAGWKENLLYSEKILLPNFAKNFDTVDVIVQDVSTRNIIMATSADKRGYFSAIETEFPAYLYSPQHERWYKENPDAHIQRICQILVDCDGDALVYKIYGTNTFHNGSQSSFYRTFSGKYIAETPLCAENLFSAETEVAEWLFPEAI